VGAHAYLYFVPFSTDAEGALRALQAQVRAASTKPHPPLEGPDAIVDVAGVTSEPTLGFAAPLPTDLAEEVFEGAPPTRQALEGEQAGAIFESLDRGQCVFVTVYDEGRATELCFLGYSVD
jgi:hypothetical protein